MPRTNSAPTLLSTHHIAAGLLALPAFVMAILVTGCAENPADGVTPASVSESAAPVVETTPDVSGDAEAPVADASGAEDPAEVVIYDIHPGNSKIEFVGSKVTRSHDGGFRDFSGTLEVRDGDPESASLAVTIKTESIWSDEEQLTGHLKSPDFFEVATYPESTFVLNRVTSTDSGYEISGEFTLHGVTKHISFPADVSVTDEAVRATSQFVIDRFDFGIEYPGMADDLIRREVVIKLDVNAERRGA
jgi:polyisoprenoid-binding protein YceI